MAVIVNYKQIKVFLIPDLQYTPLKVFVAIAI